MAHRPRLLQQPRSVDRLRRSGYFAVNSLGSSANHSTKGPRRSLARPPSGALLEVLMRPDPRHASDQVEPTPKKHPHGLFRFRARQLRSAWSAAPMSSSPAPRTAGRPEPPVSIGRVADVQKACPVRLPAIHRSHRNASATGPASRRRDGGCPDAVRCSVALFRKTP